MDRLDSFCSSRERLVMLTSLWRDDVVLEPNMFPCTSTANAFIITVVPLIIVRMLYSYLRYLTFLPVDATPVGIEHYTLWSVQDLSHDEVRVNQRRKITKIFGKTG